MEQTATTKTVNPVADNTAQAHSVMYWIAFGFAILSTIYFGILLIPLAWMIPMDIRAYHSAQSVGTSQEQSHLGLGICGLIFMSFIGGILIIISSAMFKSKQTETQVG